MAEQLMPFLSLIIPSITIVILFYWTIYSHKLEEIVTVSLENFVKDVSSDAEIQKNVYMLGGLLGNGAKSGFGLQKKSGKKGLQDLAINLIASKLGFGENPRAENVKSEDQFKVE